jgi:hypothetical protein
MFENIYISSCSPLPRPLLALTPPRAAPPRPPQEINEATALVLLVPLVPPLHLSTLALSSTFNRVPVTSRCHGRSCSLNTTRVLQASSLSLSLAFAFSLP